ncbi:MAG: hypothetical protein V1722_05785 [Candidatus Micrarchaeota archaeon]
MKKTILAAFIMLLVIGMATQASALLMLKPQSVALATVIKPQASNPVGFIHQTGNPVGLICTSLPTNPIGEKLWKPTKAANVGIRVLG